MIYDQTFNKKVKVMRWSEIGTDKKLSMIKEIYEAGDSYGTIAKKIERNLGAKVTRNSIAGLYDRNRGPLADYPIGSSSAPFDNGKTRRRVSPPEFQFPANLIVGATPEEAMAYDATAPRVSAAEHTNRQCKWVLERGKFCAHPRMPMKPYCEHHQRRATCKGDRDG